MTTEMTTTEVAEAQKTSGIFQTFTTGKAVAPDVQDKCNEYMSKLRDELSRNRTKYLDYGIAFRSKRRDVIRNSRSQYIVEVLFLVDDGRRPFPYEVVVASIHSHFSTEKNEFFYVIEKELGYKIGSDHLTQESFSYLTDTVNVPVMASELIGMELRELQTYIWFGGKKATEGRGLRDLVIKHVKGVQDTSFTMLANVTIGLVGKLFRRREATRPL